MTPEVNNMKLLLVNNKLKYLLPGKVFWASLRLVSKAKSLPWPSVKASTWKVLVRNGLAYFELTLVDEKKKSLLIFDTWSQHYETFFLVDEAPDKLAKIFVTQQGFLGES